MDKKNTIIGVSLLIAAFAVMFLGPKPQPTPPAAPPPATYDGSPATTQPSPAPLAGSPIGSPIVPEANVEKLGETLAYLENEFIRVTFTNYGGAIKEIALLQQKRTLDSEDPYVINELRYAPALNLTTYLGDARDTVFEQIPAIERDTIVFRAKLGEQLEVTRRYAITQSSEDAAPYTISHSTEYRNLGELPLPIGETLVNLGTIAPSGRQDVELQSFGYYDGEDTEFYAQSKFNGGGWIFKDPPRPIIEDRANLVWGSVKNQFFITILTPETPAIGFVARAVDFPHAANDTFPHKGITADLRLAGPSIAPGETYAQNLSLFAGPKEHTRLAKLKQGQEKAMDFGFFGFVSKPLLLLMNFIHSFVPSWGITIILLTLVVRGALLPITLMSMKSMKKMSKLAEPMKALKEKFPNDTQKQQVLMMELYKLNKVNPVAGCLPLLAQMPIFFGLFYMLRSAAELRFADFLWIPDLSQPDTILTIPGVPFFGDFPLNALPFVWLVSLVYQMWTMPTPTVDNAQFKMMKFMPFIFFPFTYTFSSGLVLYWTVSNVFTIGQQWLTNRADPNFEIQLPAALKKAMEAPAGGAKRRKK